MNAPEADDVLAVVPPVFKLLRTHKLLHREVPRRRLEVLPERDDVDTAVAEIEQRVDDLVVRLPQAEHDR